MPRGYLSATVRCRQLEHLVHRSPGITITALVAETAMSYQSVCTYMHRLQREKRVEVLMEDPAAHNSLHKFYPPGKAPLRPPAAQKAA